MKTVFDKKSSAASLFIVGKDITPLFTTIMVIGCYDKFFYRNNTFRFIASINMKAFI